MIKESCKNKEVKQINYPALAVSGFLVGLIIGFLGDGGRILIIPALLFLAYLNRKETVGTPRFIIFINSQIGLAVIYLVASNWITNFY